MMKKYYPILGAFVSTGLFSQQQFCQPSFQYNSDGNMITQVVFGSINKTSSFQSGSTPSYEDFSDLTTEVQLGSTHPISIKAPSSTFPSDVVVFIDFNQNGNFDDPGESFYVGRVQPANPANAQTVSNNIIIPQSATVGRTRMRILKDTNVDAFSDANAANKIVNACQNLRSGQAEDYSIDIMPTSLSTVEIENLNLKIYPNPTLDYVKIQSTLDVLKFDVFTMSGRKVLTGKEKIINLSKYPSGTYLLKVTFRNNKEFNQKIIKK